MIWLFYILNCLWLLLTDIIQIGCGCEFIVVVLVDGICFTHLAVELWILTQLAFFLSFPQKHMLGAFCNCL